MGKPKEEEEGLDLSGLEAKLDQVLAGQAKLAEQLQLQDSKLDQVLADGKGLQKEVGAAKTALTSLADWVKRMARHTKAAIAA